MNARTVGIRIILALRFPKWYLFDRYTKPTLHRLQSVTHHVANAGTQFLTFIWVGRVRIRKEANFSGVLLQLLHLAFSPIASKRGNSVVDTNTLKLHRIGCPFHQIEFIFFGSLAYGRINSKN